MFLKNKKKMKMKEQQYFAKQLRVKHHDLCSFEVTFTLNLPELKLFVVFDWNMFVGSSCDNVKRHEGMLDDTF
jgi:hypothetical protein